MNEGMEVGPCIGIYEANEKTALLKHHDREQGETVAKLDHG